MPRGVRGVVAKAIVDLLDAYREQYDIEFTVLATTTVYGPRQRPDGGVVAAMLGCGASRSGAAADGRWSADAGLRVRRRRRRRAGARRAGRGSGLVVNVGTGVQTSLRELWTVIAPDGPAPTLVPARSDELLRFAASPGAGPHPPRLVAVDRTGRRASARCCVERRSVASSGVGGRRGRATASGRSSRTGTTTGASRPRPTRAQVRVDRVDDERAGDRRVEPATPTTDGSWPSSASSRSAGPFSAAPPTIGDTATTDSRRAASSVVDAGEGADRPDRHDRVGRCDDDDLGRRRARRCTSLVGRRSGGLDADGLDGNGVAQAHEVVLERDRLAAGQHDRGGRLARPSSAAAGRRHPRRPDLVGHLRRTARPRRGERCGRGGWRGRGRRG